ncbi:MAG: HyaD/HybD family hydrogenase maturation endopeptidase [Syntrophobacterales bacterium]|jgi:hydrogenase maturation protease
MESKQIMILGVGNLLFTDEGVGVRVAEALQDRYEFPENVRVVDGGTLGLNLLGIISDTDHLIVVDAVRNNGDPGTLYRLAGEEIPKRIRAKNSLHQVDLLEALTCCQALDKVPETVIIGVEPEDITTLGIELTPTVSARVEDLVNRVLEELTSLGVGYCSKKEHGSCTESEFVRRI